MEHIQRKKPGTRAYSFGNAAVLTAGLALSSCNSGNSTPPATSGGSGYMESVDLYQSTCKERVEATNPDSSRDVNITVCSSFGCYSGKETRSTTTVHLDDRVTFGQTPLRVSGIDPSGVDFAIEGQGVDKGERYRANFGQQKKMGEFVLVATLRAEPADDPLTAKIVVCNPAYPVQ